MKPPQTCKGGDITKKYLALLLTAIMAVSVLSAAGVVMTKKVTAADAPPYTIVVESGRTYTFTAHQLNWHETTAPTTTDPTLRRVVSSVAGNAYAFLSSKRHSDYPGAFALVGVKWTLEPPAGKTWEEVEGTHVHIKVTLSYRLSVNGGGSLATARIMDWEGIRLGEAGGNTHPSAVRMKTTTLTLENGPYVLSELHKLDGVFLRAMVGLAPTKTPASATAQLTVDSIEIAFP